MHRFNCLFLLHDVNLFVVLVSQDVDFVRLSPLPYSNIQFFLWYSSSKSYGGKVFVTPAKTVCVLDLHSWAWLLPSWHWEDVLWQQLCNCSWATAVSLPLLKTRVFCASGFWFFYALGTVIFPWCLLNWEAALPQCHIHALGPAWGLQEEGLLCWFTGVLFDLVYIKKMWSSSQHPVQRGNTAAASWCLWVTARIKSFQGI